MYRNEYWAHRRRRRRGCSPRSVQFGRFDGRQPPAGAHRFFGKLARFHRFFGKLSRFHRFFGKLSRFHRFFGKLSRFHRQLRVQGFVGFVGFVGVGRWSARFDRFDGWLEGLRGLRRGRQRRDGWERLRWRRKAHRRHRLIREKSRARYGSSRKVLNKTAFRGASFQSSGAVG
jgi:hypothetical protein